MSQPQSQGDTGVRGDTPVADHPRPTITVRCVFGPFGSPVRHFTDQKCYTATHYKNSLYELRDDRGHVRYVTPDEPCPHLPPPQKEYRSFLLGKFETMP